DRGWHALAAPPQRDALARPAAVRQEREERADAPRHAGVGAHAGRDEPGRTLPEARLGAGADEDGVPPAAVAAQQRRSPAAGDAPGVLSRTPPHRPTPGGHQNEQPQAKKPPHLASRGPASSGAISRESFSIARLRAGARSAGCPAPAGSVSRDRCVRSGWSTP